MNEQTVTHSTSVYHKNATFNMKIVELTFWFIISEIATFF